MITAVVGVGGWGARVAEKLAVHQDVYVSAVFDADADRARRIALTLPPQGRWNSDPVPALANFVQYLDVQTPDAVVLAVPAGCRMRFVEAVCKQYREKKQRIRIEKPLGLDVAEAEQIAALCRDAGVDVTIGFTLLHHPLYEAAFAYLEATGVQVQWVEGVRLGKPARHPAPALLDVGIHTASIAAYLDVPASIHASYDDHASMRVTTIHTSAGRILINETAWSVVTPHGPIDVASGDALERDLDAWVRGKHRGTLDVALRAQELVEDTASVLAVAS